MRLHIAGDTKCAGQRTGPSLRLCSATLAHDGSPIHVVNRKARHMFNTYRAEFPCFGEPAFRPYFLLSMWMV